MITRNNMSSSLQIFATPQVGYFITGSWNAWSEAVQMEAIHVMCNVQLGIEQDASKIKLVRC